MSVVHAVGVMKSAENTMNNKLRSAKMFDKFRAPHVAARSKFSKFASRPLGPGAADLRVKLLCAPGVHPGASW